jgi:hypothetical protein
MRCGAYYDKLAAANLARKAKLEAATRAYEANCARLAAERKAKRALQAAERKAKRDRMWQSFLNMFKRSSHNTHEATVSIV